MLFVFCVSFTLVFSYRRFYTYGLVVLFVSFFGLFLCVDPRQFGHSGGYGEDDQPAEAGWPGGFLFP